MSRKRKASNTSNLFPFLAVLISAMGALILLLLIVAQKAGKDRDAEYAQNRDKMIAEATNLPALPEKKTFPDVALVPDLVIPELVEHKLEPLPEIVDRRLEIQRKIAEVRRELKARTDSVKSTSDLPDKNARLSELSASLQSLQAQLEKIKRAKEEAAKQSAKLKSDYAALDARRRELERKSRAASERYSIVPYYGPNGTNREPIYIECRGSSITILPEGIELKPNDLPDANDAENVLAKVMRVLMTQERSNGRRPYPLIVVRPDGVATFYIARGALSFLETDYGYELVPDNVDLEFGELDPKAKELAQKVVDDHRSHPRPMRPSGGRAFVLDDRPPSSQGGGEFSSNQAGFGSGSGRNRGPSYQPIPQRSPEELKRIADSLPSMPATGVGGGFGSSTNNGEMPRNGSGAEGDSYAQSGGIEGAGTGFAGSRGRNQQGEASTLQSDRPGYGAQANRGGHSPGTGWGGSETNGQGNRGSGGMGWSGAESAPGLPPGMSGQPTDVDSLANQGSPLAPPQNGSSTKQRQGFAGGFASDPGQTSGAEDVTLQGNGQGKVPGGQGFGSATPGQGNSLTRGNGSQGSSRLLSAANGRPGNGEDGFGPHVESNGEGDSVSLSGSGDEENVAVPPEDESSEPLLTRNTMNGTQTDRGPVSGSAPNGYPVSNNRQELRGHSGQPGGDAGAEFDELTSPPGNPSVAEVEQPLRARSENSPAGERVESNRSRPGQRPVGTPSSNGSRYGQGAIAPPGYRGPVADGKNQSQGAQMSANAPGTPSTAPTEFEQAMAEVAGSSGGSGSGGSGGATAMSPGSLTVPLPGMKPASSSDQASDDGESSDPRKKKDGAPMIQPSIGPSGRIKATVRKTVTIECRKSGVTLYPGGRFIPYDGDPSMKSMKKEIYRHVADQMLTWGSASEVHRWSPVLEVNVRPDGLERYYDLRFAMIGSGLEVEERLLGWRDDLDFHEFFGAGKQADSARRNVEGTIRR
jgi:hypothetical protein